MAYAALITNQCRLEVYNLKLKLGQDYGDDTAALFNSEECVHQWDLLKHNRNNSRYWPRETRVGLIAVNCVRLCYRTMRRTTVQFPRSERHIL